MRTILFLLLIVFPVSATSQSSVTATATVTVLKPLTFTKAADMNFTEVAVSKSGGTVILSPYSSRTASGEADILSQDTQTLQAASFKIKSEEATFSISVPEEILLSDGSRTLRVDNFSYNSTGILEDGGEILHIGATLHVNGMQEPGTYQNTKDFRVTIQHK